MDVACPAWSEATLNVYSLPLANQLAADIQCYIKDFSNEEPVQVVSRRWLASHVSSTARLLLQADKQTIRPIFASEGFITGLFTANPNPPADCGLGGLPIASAWGIAD